ncbi:hypothetical protein BC828DRAFT_405541 [Blastocladiella britannica]|nr:hypothetical protein BC828DRAFT_405541 [Blastocladiella britannica]
MRAFSVGSAAAATAPRPPTLPRKSPARVTTARSGTTSPLPVVATASPWHWFTSPLRKRKSLRRQRSRPLARHPSSTGRALIAIPSLAGTSNVQDGDNNDDNLTPLERLVAERRAAKARLSPTLPRSNGGAEVATVTVPTVTLDAVSTLQRQASPVIAIMPLTAVPRPPSVKSGFELRRSRSPAFERVYIDDKSDVHALMAQLRMLWHQLATQVLDRNYRQPPAAMVRSLYAAMTVIPAIGRVGDDGDDGGMPAFVGSAAPAILLYPARSDPAVPMSPPNSTGFLAVPGAGNIADEVFTPGSSMHSSSSTPAVASTSAMTGVGVRKRRSIASHTSTSTSVTRAHALHSAQLLLKHHIAASCYELFVKLEHSPAVAGLRAMLMRPRDNIPMLLLSCPRALEDLYDELVADAYCVINTSRATAAATARGTTTTAYQQQQPQGAPPSPMLTPLLHAELLGVQTRPMSSSMWEDDIAAAASAAAGPNQLPVPKRGASRNSRVSMSAPPTPPSLPRTVHPDPSLLPAWFIDEGVTAGDRLAALARREISTTAMRVMRIIHAAGLAPLKPQTVYEHVLRSLRLFLYIQDAGDDLVWVWTEQDQLGADAGAEVTATLDGVEIVNGDALPHAPNAASTLAGNVKVLFSVAPGLARDRASNVPRPLSVYSYNGSLDLDVVVPEQVFVVARNAPPPLPSFAHWAMVKSPVVQQQSPTLLGSAVESHGDLSAVGSSSDLAGSHTTLLPPPQVPPKDTLPRRRRSPAPAPMVPPKPVLVAVTDKVVSPTSCVPDDAGIVKPPSVVGKHRFLGHLGRWDSVVV